MLKEQEVKDTLRDLIDEYGDDHQAKCTYSDMGGNPRCIIGHLVARLEPDTFKQLAQSYLTFDAAVDHGMVSVETEALGDQLSRLQTLQDRLTPWGEAVRKVFPGLLS